jgi:hypothetical protein
MAANLRARRGGNAGRKTAYEKENPTKKPQYYDHLVHHLLPPSTTQASNFYPSLVFFPFLLGSSGVGFCREFGDQITDITKRAFTR